jgi:hypothetical protein
MVGVKSRRVNTQKPILPVNTTQTSYWYERHVADVRLHASRGGVVLRRSSYLQFLSSKIPLPYYSPVAF